METISGVWQDGRIMLDEPVSWADGQRLAVAPLPDHAVELMEESEQPNDPEARRRWAEELLASPTLTAEDVDEAALAAWRLRMKETNLEAMRRAMAAEAP